jgi:lysophospholipase L1-like esterase
MRITKVLVIGLLGYWAIGLMGCSKREIKNLDAKGDTIICFGDSITCGYGAEAGEDYPAELAKLTKMRVVNSGINGDTSRQGIARIGQDVLAQQPRLVIIEFCGNDFLKKVPYDETLKNLRLMVQRAQEEGILVAVVDISAGMFMREYRRDFRKIANEEGAIFISQALKGIITNPSMKGDFLHPNAAGYKLLAQRVYTAVKPYLKK